MKLLHFFILVVILGTLLAHPARVIGGECRSAQGGYCVSLVPLETERQRGSLTGLAASIPGLEFLGEVRGGIGGLLSRIFIFGMSLVGVAAFAMLVLGGILYLTARDSQDQVKQARSHMGNAIFGLLLALISWLILYTINPDLVQTLQISPAPILPAPPPGGITPGGLSPGGATQLPRQGFFPPAPAPTTLGGKCSQYYTLIDGKCYAFVTEPPCNPPNFYTHVAGKCFLKRELTPGR